MSDRAVLRLQRELLDVRKNLDQSSSVYLHYNDNNIMNVKALIVGPFSTPYAGGLFEFNLTFPKEYPTVAPKALAQTTNYGTTRFNPNIYACGKVCLSILGTWQGQPGEQWSSAHGVSSVLLSIQSLMSEKPYHNEPGFEKVRPGEDKKVEDYNLKIRHETIRISICDRLERLLNIRSLSTSSSSSVLRKTIDAVMGTGASPNSKKCAEKSADEPGEEFAGLMKGLFMCYFDVYMETIRTESEKVKPGQGFTNMSFEHHKNSMDGTFQYPQLKERLIRIRQTIQAETESWQLESIVWIATDSSASCNLRRQFEQIKAGKDFEGYLEIELRDDNPFVWDVLVFGRPMTHYDGGMFKCKIAFNESFPDTLPRVEFRTPVYHPHITEDGIPFYRVAREDDVRSHLSAICDLFRTDPGPNPCTHVNPKAAALYFGTKEERREYNRAARKCSNRSVEY